MDSPKSNEPVKISPWAENIKLWLVFLFLTVVAILIFWAGYYLIQYRLVSKLDANNHKTWTFIKTTPLPKYKPALPSDSGVRKKKKASNRGFYSLACMLLAMGYWAIKNRRIDHLTNSKVPIQLSDLAANPIYKKYCPFHPHSKMYRYLGAQYTVDQLLQSEKFDEADRDELQRVRAFEVRPLMHATFRIKSEDDLAQGILGLLLKKMPGINWQVKGAWQGPLLKYCIVHGSITAPPDLLAKQPMALEIYGQLIEIDKIVLDSPAGYDWLRKRQRSVGEAGSQEKPYPKLIGDMVVEIQQAVYANILYPGIGVPDYL